MVRSVGFIPSGPLLFAQAMLLVSWLALFGVGASQSFGISPQGLVWIHAVVLGWLTTTSLAFMIHVVPGFTDVEWRFERFARNSIVIFEAGVVLLILGFWLWKPPVLAVGGGIIVAALSIFSFTFLATVGSVLRTGDRAAKSVARAFVAVVAALAAAAIIGLVMSIWLAGGKVGPLQFAPVHATIGIVGWISLLVAGVSTRTFNRLIGKADRRAAHIITSVAVLIGFVLWIAGSIAHQALIESAGGVALVASALFYAGSTLWALHSATATHRLPRQFLFASMVWLVVAALFGSAVLAGFDLQSAMIFALLIGWVGQTVNAHLMHTGIRLLATIIIGDEDQTPPMQLLDRRLGAASYFVSQAAVLLGVTGLCAGIGTLVQLAAIFGLAAMAVMAANVARAAGLAYLKLPR